MENTPRFEEPTSLQVELLPEIVAREAKFAK